MHLRFVSHLYLTISLLWHGKLSHMKGIWPIAKILQQLLKVLPLLTQHYQKKHKLEMWANAKPDGRPAEYRWRPLFNATKFGWRPVLDAVQ